MLTFYVLSDRVEQLAKKYNRLILAIATQSKGASCSPRPSHVQARWELISPTPVYPSARSSSPCALSEIFLCVCTIYYNPINLTPKERPKRTLLRFDSLSPALPPPRRSMRVHVCVMERKAIPSPTDIEVVHSSVRPSFRPPDSPFLCFLLPSNGRWRRRKPLITVAGLCGACGRSASAPVMTDD